MPNFKTFSSTKRKQKIIFSFANYVTNGAVHLLSFLLSCFIILFIPAASFSIVFLCQPLPLLSSPVYTVFVRAQNSHLSLLGSLPFSLLRSSLLFLLCVFHAGRASSSCMQRGACSRLRLSHKGPRGVMLQSFRPQGSCFHLSVLSLSFLSCSFLSLSPQDFNALVFPFRLRLPHSPPFSSLTFLICLSDSSTSATFHWQNRLTNMEIIRHQNTGFNSGSQGT